MNAYAHAAEFCDVETHSVDIWKYTYGKKAIMLISPIDLDGEAWELLNAYVQHVLKRKAEEFDKPEAAEEGQGK